MEIQFIGPSVSLSSRVAYPVRLITSDHGMLEPRTQRSSRFVEEAARIIFFERRSAGSDSVNLNGCAGGSAGDFQFVAGSEQGACEQKESCAEQMFRAGSHERTSRDE
jgi:hypothetical protein